MPAPHLSDRRVRPSRRAVLLGAGLSLAGLPAAAALAGCGSEPVSVGTVESGSFTSALRGGQRTGWTIVRPPGHREGRLRVLVTLHARSGSHTSAFAHLQLDRHLAHVVLGGAQPFAIASVDGGDHEYWHPRHGTDPAGMVVHEFLPLLARHGLRTDRIGLLGWSMGGYGALYLAGVLGAARVAVAVAASPAIWLAPGDSAAGAFDDAADFTAHDVFRRLDALRGIPLRVDCGAADGFAPAVRRLRADLHPTPAGGIEPGEHDVAYWRTQAVPELRFVGTHLPH